MEGKKLLRVTPLIFSSIILLSGCSTSSSEKAAPEPSASNTIEDTPVIDCRTVKNLYEKIVMENPTSYTAAWELNILAWAKIVKTAPDCFSATQLQESEAVIAQHEKNFRG